MIAALWKFLLEVLGPIGLTLIAAALLVIAVEAIRLSIGQ
jgi:hypothetical protein